MKGQNKEIKDELREAPFLQKMKDQQEGYTLPKGYFIQLQDELLSNLEEDAPQPWWASLWWQVRQPKIAMALAGLVLLVLSLWVFLPRQDENDFQQLTYEELDAYIQSNLHEFELDLLLEYTWNEQTELDILSEEDYNSSEFNEYLEDILNEMDASTLEELL